MEVTELVLPAGTVRHHAGQFAWINIPAVSEHEWHPFTIASAPSAAELAFHIKAMGKGTFTAKLLAFAAQCEAQGTPGQVVRIDGPYGRGPYLTECETALMVCGGIGVTPMISQLAELYAAAARSGTGTVLGRPKRQVRLRKVHLVWSVRDTGLLALYRNLLESIVLAAPGSGGVVVGGIAFEVSIHCTRDSDHFARAGAGHDVSAIVKHVQRGRPDFRKLLAQLALSKGRISVSVCGPDPMIAGLAAAAADTPNCDFHREIFHY